MRIALIADIHTNLHALKAVLQEISQAGMPYDNKAAAEAILAAGLPERSALRLLR